MHKESANVDSKDRPVKNDQRIPYQRTYYGFASTIRLVGYERVEKRLVWLHERLQKEAGGDYERIERLRSTGPKMQTEEFATVIRAVATFHETAVELSSITVPTLVVCGEREPHFIRRHVPIFGATLPNVTVRVVPDAGHASTLDNPEFFTAAVRNVLAGHADHHTGRAVGHCENGEDAEVNGEVGERPV